MSMQMEKYWEQLHLIDHSTNSRFIKLVFNGLHSILNIFIVDKYYIVSLMTFLRSYEFTNFCSVN